MALNKVALAPEKKDWVGKRDVILRSEPLYYNASSQQKYYSQLYQLHRKMADEVRNEIVRLEKSRVAASFVKQQEAVLAADSSNNLGVEAEAVFKKLSKKYNELFEKNSIGLANAMWSSQLKNSSSSLMTSLKKLTGGLTLKTSVIPKGLETVSKAAIAENVSLIKSIPNQYLKKIEGAVYRSITSGKGLSDLIPKVSKYSAQSQRQIKNMAYDQTRKAYNSINQQRMMAVGVKKFIWRHSGGGQSPREDHIAMDGKVYSFDKLPIIDKATGERGIPGQAINCGCTMEPVIEFEDGTEI